MKYTIGFTEVTLYDVTIEAETYEEAYAQIKESKDKWIKRADAELEFHYLGIEGNEEETDER